MSLINKSRKEIIAEFAQGKNDTGSPEVQCAIATAQINNLTEHLKTHKKDHASKRGLINTVGRRRKLLDYLKSKSQEKYEDLIKRLEIRK
jgi:small subunit ribosomal protein S15